MFDLIIGFFVDEAEMLVYYLTGKEGKNRKKKKETGKRDHDGERKTGSL